MDTSASWPEVRLLVAMIEERFDYLVRDHWFERQLVSPPLVSYDLTFMSMLIRIRVAPDLNSLVLDVDCSWPDQAMTPADEPPTISLTDIVAMRSAGDEVPSDLSSMEVAQRTLDRSASLLREHAIDALSGGSGLWFDFVDWKRLNGDLGAGRWWGHPMYDEIAEVSKPRTAEQIERDMEFQPIHARAHRDPHAAWSEIVAFIRRHPASLEAESLLEDVMEAQPDEFIERVDTLARTDEAVRQTLAMAAGIGGDARAAIERYNDLIERLREADS